MKIHNIQLKVIKFIEEYVKHTYNYNEREGIEVDDVIFKSLSVSNFGPFKDEIKFTTEIDYSKKEYLDTNTFEEKEETFNKVSYIYGPNGSGKSNFCKAILQIQKIIALSPLIASNNSEIIEMNIFKKQFEDITNYFKFEKNCDKTPTSYSIEIIINKITYMYSFKLLDEKIIEEKLYKKNKRKELILNRTSPHYKDIELKSELSSFKQNIGVVKEKALCLSMANFLNNELANKIIEAISKIVVINMSTFKILRSINEEDYSKEKVERYLKILRCVDPTIKDLRVKFTENERDKLRNDSNEADEKNFIVKNVEVKIESVHDQYDKDKKIGEVALPFFQMQSNGAIKILSVMPLIIKIIDEGGTIIVDEIENGLHSNAERTLIDLFYQEKYNPKNAQLICTTHNTALIEKGIRRDQIWFLDKNEMGQSSIMRLSDIKVRPNENFGQKYLQGSYGAVPKMNL